MLDFGGGNSFPSWDAFPAKGNISTTFSRGAMPAIGLLKEVVVALRPEKQADFCSQCW